MRFYAFGLSFFTVRLLLCVFFSPVPSALFSGLFSFLSSCLFSCLFSCLISCLFSCLFSAFFTPAASFEGLLSFLFPLSSPLCGLLPFLFSLVFGEADVSAFSSGFGVSMDSSWCIASFFALVLLLLPVDLFLFTPSFSCKKYYFSFGIYSFFFRKKSF